MNEESPNNNPQDKKKEVGVLTGFKEYGPYLTLGFQLAAAVVVFFFLGDWFDKHYGTAPIGKLAGTLIGMTGGFIKFFKSISKMIENEERNRTSGKHEN